MRFDKDPLSVVERQTKETRLVEADVIRLLPEIRKAAVRLRKTSQEVVVSLGAIEPSAVRDDRAGLLLYVSPTGGGLIPIAVIPKRIASSSSPGVTLGDRTGATYWAIMNSSGQIVFMVDSLGQATFGAYEAYEPGSYLTGEPFLTASYSSTLTSERVLTAGTGIDLTDGGAGSTMLVAVDITDFIGSGLVENLGNIDLDWGTPTIGTIEPDDAASAGSSTNPARSDHQHAIVAATPGSIEPDDSAAEGVATSFARSDHVHGIVAATPGTIEPDDAAAEGSATSFTRSDHQHAIAAAAPTTNLSDSTTNQEGSATSFARSDHTHAVDGITDISDAPYVVVALSGDLSAERKLTAGDGIGLADGGANGDITVAVDVTDILGSGVTESSNNIDLDWGTPTIGTIEPDDSASAGSGTNPARSDHQHAIVAAAPTTNLSDSTTNQEGTATSFSRSDHTHAVDGLTDISDAQYVVMALSGDLSAERVLTAGDGLGLADGGANGNATLSVDVTDILGSGLTESSNNIDLDWGTPTIGTIEPDDSASAGASTNPARSDHQHAIVAASAGSIQPDDSAAEGSASSFARSDHTHGIVAAAPGSNLSVSTTNAEGSASSFSRSDHGHAITSSNNPGAAASILASDASGYLTLVRLNTDTIGDRSGGNLTIGPTGDVIFDPVGNDILPNTNYDLNVGSITKKYLTIHAAELWVGNLVAQDTISTIGGRAVIGPSTLFAADLSSATVNSAEKMSNTGFETAGGGGADVFANWTEYASDGEISQDAGIYYAGSYSAGLQCGATYDTHVYQDFAVTDTDQILVHFWTRGDGVYAGRYRIYDVTNTADIVPLVSTYVPGTSWQMVVDDFDVPTDCVSARLYLYCPGTYAASSYFDEVSAITGVSITVEHNEMVAGDVAYAEENANVEFLLIGSAATANGSYYDYWVERDLDGTGENDWYAGSTLLNTGQVDDGFIDLYSIGGMDSKGYGPTIVGNVRNSAAYNDWTPRWGIGNLSGIYGYAADEYGVALGEYGADHITVDSTNGIRFRDASDNLHLLIDSGGVELYSNAIKVVDLDTSGNVTLGQVATDQGNAYWNYSNKRLEFRGGTNGTEVEAYIDTDGSITAGGGIVKLDSGGIDVLPSSMAYGSEYTYSFGSYADFWCYVTSYGNYAGVKAYSRPMGPTTLHLSSESSSAQDATITIAVSGGGVANTATITAQNDYSESKSLITINADEITLDDADLIQFDLADSAGASSVVVRDFTPSTVASIDSNGQINTLDGICIGHATDGHGAGTLTLRLGTDEDPRIIFTEAGDDLFCFGLDGSANELKINSSADDLDTGLSVFRLSTGGYANVLTSLFIGDTSTLAGAGTIQISKASGDPSLVFDIGGTDKFTVGVDDSDSDKFKINSGGSLADASDFEFDSSGNFTYLGNLKSEKASTVHDVYAFVPLTEPYTVFGGASFSDVASHTKIENTSWSTTIPADAKALAVQMQIRDSGSASTNAWFALYATSSATNPALLTYLQGVTNDALRAGAGVVPCTDGDIWYQCEATGSSTLDVWLYCTGYFI